MSNSKSPISINEHLSALLDDEAGNFEERRVLDELKTNQDLSQKLSSYALIGETMRAGEAEKPVLTLDSSFLNSIHEKIELEDSFNDVVIKTGNEAPLDTHDKASNGILSWLRPAGGFAVAASVGALAFMGLQNMGVLNNSNPLPSGTVGNPAPTQVAQPAPEIKPEIESTAEVINATNDDQYVDADAKTRSMLKRYVDSHMQYATTSTFVPSVRVIAYTDSQ